jgi:hypothetical protein
MCGLGNAMEDQLTGSTQLQKTPKELALEAIVLSAIRLQIFIVLGVGGGFAVHNWQLTEKWKKMGKPCHMIQSSSKSVSRETNMQRMKKYVGSFLAGTRCTKQHGKQKGLFQEVGVILTVVL